MYKVVEIIQDELPEYKGKILQVISGEKREVNEYCFGGHQVTHSVWMLTCLVEEEESK